MSEPTSDESRAAGILELALTGRTDARTVGDLLTLASAAYERIRKLERITDRLLSLAVEAEDARSETSGHL